MHDVLQIDIEKSLEEQGPFDMILHKFTDILVKSQQGYITEQRTMRSIEVGIHEPRHEQINILHMRKQRRRSASL